MHRMTSTFAFFLALLLMAPPALADGPDDPVKDGDDEPQQEFTMRYVPSYQNYFMPQTRAHFYVNGAYGTVNKFFDGDGDAMDLGTFQAQPGEVETNAEVMSYAVHIGGAYDVSQIGMMKVRLGADLALFNRNVTSDETSAGPITIPAIDQSSGFAPQNVTIFGEIAQPTYKLRAGYFLDLGQEPEDADEAENSDMQNAIMLGISGQYPTETFRLFAGFDYFLTLKGEREDDTEFDNGDIAVVQAGAGFRITPEAEIGAAVLYRINTEGELAGTDGSDLDASEFPGLPNEFDGGNSIGIAPYITYAPTARPYQVYLKGAVQREYFDYGYTVAGENDIAPRLGFTLGFIYGLDV